MDTPIVKQEFLNMETFKNMQEFAKYLKEDSALPKWIDSAGKLVMILQAWRDMWLSVTQSMSWLAIISGVVTIYWAVAAVMMKRAGWDWKVKPLVPVYWDDGKTIIDYIKTVEIWKTWPNNEELKKQDVQYTYIEASKAWSGKDTPDVWKKYLDRMMYRKCLSKARVEVCPEVLDGVAIYEDYSDMDYIDGDKIGSDTASPIMILKDKIMSSQSMEELDGYLTDIRQSKDQNSIAYYTQRKKELENLPKSNDEDATKDPTSISEQIVDVQELPKADPV